MTGIRQIRYPEKLSARIRWPKCLGSFGAGTYPRQRRTGYHRAEGDA